MNARSLALGLALFTVGGTVFALAQPAGQPAGQAQHKPEKQVETDEGDQVITFEQAPESVRAAAIKLAGDAKNITKVIKEEDEDDVYTFEVEYNEGATKCAAIFSQAGDLMETEKAIPEASLPAAALAALKKEYPNATFANSQAVKKMFFEVEVVINGKKHEVKVDASGDIEDKSHDHDEHHEANGEDHDEKHNKKDNDKD